MDNRWSGEGLLHGQVHDRWRVRDRMIDVGVDVWNFRPVSEQALGKLLGKTAKTPNVPTPLGPWLEAREAGEPVVLTLSQLRRWPLAPLASDATAYVVENPSLVAEATRTG